MVIRMKGVKRVIAKGRVYYYHRATLTRLPGAPGTTIFMDALAALDAKGAVKAVPGTLGALICAYRASPEFGALAKRTRSDYQRVFDYVKPLAELPLIEADAARLYDVRDRAFSKRRRRFANYVVQVLSRLFNWGRRRGICERNPAADVEMLRRPRDARVVNRPWTPAEVETVLGAASPRLKVAIALGVYLGLREADMLDASWASYDGTAFEIRQRKTGTSLWVPAHSRLRAILDEAKKKRTSPVIVVNERGRPYTQSGFQTRFFGLVRRLRDHGAIAPGLSFHGLRHTVGKQLAEAGCDARTIAAVLGHATMTMADHYSRDADRKGLAKAALERLEPRTKRQRIRKTSVENRKTNRS